MNTYSPRTGYDVETIKDYRGKTNAYISLIPTKYIKLWCTDNNGEIYRNGNNKHCVGDRDMGDKTAKVNGEHLIN